VGVALARHTAPRPTLGVAITDRLEEDGVAGGGGSGGVGGGGAGGGPRKMEGIGNPMFKDQQSKGGAGSMSIGQVAAVAGETIVGMIRDPLARNAPTPPPRTGVDREDTAGRTTHMEALRTLQAGISLHTLQGASGPWHLIAAQTQSPHLKTSTLTGTSRTTSRAMVETATSTGPKMEAAQGLLLQAESQVVHGEWHQLGPRPALVAA